MKNEKTSVSARTVQRAAITKKLYVDSPSPISLSKKLFDLVQSVQSGKAGTNVTLTPQICTMTSLVP